CFIRLKSEKYTNCPKTLSIIQILFIINNYEQREMRHMSKLKNDSLQLHRTHQGKLEIRSKVAVENERDLSLAYSPGVAEPCREIAADPAKVHDYTMKSNMVAVVTDGTAVLGLGNIGPLAALPRSEERRVGKECGTMWQKHRERDKHDSNGGHP